MSSLIKKCALPATLAFLLSGPAAQAGDLTYQGVTFTSSFAGNVLTLVIDAAHPTGDWASATTIGALAIKDIGTFSSAALTSGPGISTGWSVNDKELSANGCATGGGPGELCFHGGHVALTDHMVFTFTYTGGVQDFTSPHLKVNFFVGDGTDKVGSLLSQNIPAAPEPSSYVALLAGLGVFGLWSRRKGRYNGMM